MQACAHRYMHGHMHAHMRKSFLPSKSTRNISLTAHIHTHSLYLTHTQTHNIPQLHIHTQTHILSLSPIHCLSFSPICFCFVFRSTLRTNLHPVMENQVLCIRINNICLGWIGWLGWLYWIWNELVWIFCWLVYLFVLLFFVFVLFFSWG